MGWWHGSSKAAARRPRGPRRRPKQLSSIYQLQARYKFVETASHASIKHSYPTVMQSNQSSILAIAAAAAPFARTAVGFGASWLDTTASRPHTSAPLAACGYAVGGYSCGASSWPSVCPSWPTQKRGNTERADTASWPWPPRDFGGHSLSHRTPPIHPVLR